MSLTLISLEVRAKRLFLPNREIELKLPQHWCELGQGSNPRLYCLRLGVEPLYQWLLTSTREVPFKLVRLRKNRTKE